jgi:RHS repeat-associated protein
LDREAAEQGRRQLRRVQEALGAGSIPRLQSAQSATNGLSYARIPSLGGARSAARQTLQKLENFERALNAYVQTIEQFDHDAANRISNASVTAEWTEHSGWCADLVAVKARVRDKLIAGGMSPEDADSFMAEFGDSVLGLIESSVYCGDPINMSTGNFIYHKEDMAITGAHPLAFVRFYNALSRTRGPLGPGWTHSFNIWLTDCGTTVQVAFEDGHQEIYRLRGDGSYQPPSGRYHTLEKRGDAFLLTAKEKTEYHFTKDGEIGCIKDQNHNTTEFCHEGGLLRSVTNVCGSLHLAYTDEGLLREIKDHVGRTCSYEYHGGCLIRAEQPEGEVHQYRYSTDKVIHQIVNPRGVAAIINEYDSASRTASQHLAGGGCLKIRYEDESLSTTVTEQNNNRITFIRDGNYRTVKVLYTDSEERFAYDNQNNRTMFTDRNGNVHHFAYDQSGNLIKAVDPLNNVTRIAYNEFSKPLQVDNPDGSTVKYRYDKNGNLTQRADPLGRRWRFAHTSSGLPCRVTLPDGSACEIAHDQRGNVTSLTDSAGATFTYTYDNLNRMTESTDAEGRVIRFSYNWRGDIIKSVNALGDVREFEYGPGGKLVRTVDYGGNETCLEYNDAGQLERVVDAMGGITCYTYDVMQNVSSTTDPEGNTTRYTYDRNNRLCTIIDPEGEKTRFEHDPNGNITALVTASGAWTTVEYDAMNHAIRQTEPDGIQVQYAYDPVGRLVAATYPNGATETRAYDKAGQLIAITNLRGETTRYRYTPLGQVQRVINHLGEELRYEYYPGGRLKSIEGPQGETQHYVWDLNGNVTERMDAFGNVTKMAYDALGRVIEMRDPLGGVKTFSYDAMGRVSSRTDANGNTTRYRYSPLGSLIEVIDATGHSTRYSYDGARRLTSVEQARMIDPELGEIHEAEQQLTTYEYNRRGDITAVRSPLDATVRYTYNADGRVIVRQDEEGFESSFAYTLAGQLTQVRYADGRQVHFAYDQLRRLAEVQDWLGITRIERDGAGQVSQVTYPDGKTLGYEWDVMGRCRKVVYPDGSAVHYAHDAAGRLAEAQAAAGTIRFSYDAAGRLVHREMPGGIETDYLTDACGRLTRLVHRQNGNELDDLRYRYDKAGNIVQIEKHRAGVAADSGLFCYAYDPLNRIIEAAKDGQARRYAYDTLGNRILAEDADGQRRYSYNALNQLVCMQGSEGHEEYRYDRRGNLTDVLRDALPKSRYRYDAANMMVEAVNGLGGVAQYVYDGLLNRVKKQEALQDPEGLTGEGSRAPIETVRYTVDITRGSGGLMSMETDGSHAQNFIWGNGLLASEGDASFSYLHDHLGSPLRLLGEAEDTVMAYDEFGVPMVGLGRQAHNPFGFTGYQSDEVSGLYYAQARYYHPAASRMAGADTWKGDPRKPQSMNRYAYCVNNPVTLVDRTGNWPTPVDVLKVPGTLVDEFIAAWEFSETPIEGALRGGVYLGNVGLGAVSFGLRESGIDKDAHYNMGDLGAPLLMMEEDEDGVYHATFDCWQRHVGYNDIYDFGFDLGSNIDKDKFEFSYNGEDYIFWAWRADYLNLGAGAELGIYRREVVGGIKTEQWSVDQGLAMPMTLRLKDVQGNFIFSYYPKDPQWWITGFKPEVQWTRADDLVAIYTMDMSGMPGMFDAFYKKFFKETGRGREPGLVINPFTQTVAFTFAKRGMENACVV